MNINADADRKLRLLPLSIQDFFRVQFRLRSNMRFSTLSSVTLLAIVHAAPATRQNQVRQANTASERLGLTWLGGNSSLPKILYELRYVNGISTDIT